ncbi:MAG: hypothetical protein RSD07_02480 [Angelakisella sp.]
MKKRIVSLVLALLVAATSMSMTVFAAEPSGPPALPKIPRTEPLILSPGTPAQNPAEGWVWDGATLTLDGINFMVNSDAIIFKEKGTPKVVLTPGSHNVLTGASRARGIISSEGSLTISGSGRLTVSDRDLGGFTCIYAEDSMSIEGGATVETSGCWFGIHAYTGALNVTGGATVTVRDAESTAISTDNSYPVGKEIVIDDATVTAEGGRWGIRTDAFLTINNSTIVSTGTQEEGLSARFDITISGSTVEATGATGIATQRTLGINGSTVVAEGKECCGADVGGAVQITNNSDVTVTAVPDMPRTLQADVVPMSEEEDINAIYTTGMVILEDSRVTLKAEGPFSNGLYAINDRPVTIRGDAQVIAEGDQFGIYTRGDITIGENADVQAHGLASFFSGGNIEINTLGRIEAVGSVHGLNAGKGTKKISLINGTIFTPRILGILDTQLKTFAVEGGTVFGKPLTTAGLAPKVTVSEGKSKTVSLDTDGSVKSVVWSVHSEAVATVQPNILNPARCIITGESEGSTTLTAIVTPYQGETKTVTCTVKVGSAPDPVEPDPTEKPEEKKSDPGENEANTPETTSRITHAKTGETVAVQLVSGSADVGVSLMNTLGSAPAGTALKLTITNGLAGGSIEMVFPGGFGKVNEPGRVTYPLSYFEKAKDNDTMIKSAVGEGILSYTAQVGANITLPTVATITLKTTIPNGKTVNIYKYNEKIGKFTLIAKATVKDGKLTFTTKELGQLLFTTGTV